MSQRNVTYPVKNCNNSIQGGRIKFILESKHEEVPTQQVEHKTVAMQRRLPSNGDTKSTC